MLQLEVQQSRLEMWLNLDGEELAIFFLFNPGPPLLVENESSTCGGRLDTPCLAEFDPYSALIPISTGLISSSVGTRSDHTTYLSGKDHQW